jgi:hypothetical protein
MKRLDLLGSGQFAKCFSETALLIGVERYAKTWIINVYVNLTPHTTVLKM